MVRLSNAVNDNIEQENNTVKTNEDIGHNQDLTEEKVEDTHSSTINSISVIGNILLQKDENSLTKITSETINESQDNVDTDIKDETIENVSNEQDKEKNDYEFIAEDK